MKPIHWWSYIPFLYTVYFYRRHAMHKRRKHKKEGRSQGMRVTAISSPESTHDFHKYWMQQNGLTPVLHFHLAASINPISGI